jgi:hypothetical protein
MKTLKYNYLGSEIKISAIKNPYGMGYFMVEQLAKKNSKPQIISGPYHTKKITLKMGQKYIDSMRR